MSFAKKFDQILDELDEFIAPNTKTDYILGVFQQQGCWAGNVYRIYYCEKSGEFSYQERSFGA